jgi:hypothetical protein
MHNVRDVRQIEVHTAEPLVPGPSRQRSTNSLILFEIRKNCLINGRSQLLYQFTKRAIKRTVIIIAGSLLSTSYKILLNILLSRLVLYIDEIIGDHQFGF